MNGPVTIIDMQTPPPHFWSDFYGWWGVCYIVWEKKKFSDFYFSSYCEKFIENWRFLEQKWRKITVTPKIKTENSETWFFFLFSRLQFFHVNLTTFGEFFFFGFWCFIVVMDFFLNKIKNIYIFLQKWSNLHERSGIGW